MKQYVKAILAFVSLVVTNLLTNYSANETPLPVEGGQVNWATLLINLGTVVAGTFSVYQWPNSEQPGRHAKAE